MDNRVERIKEYLSAHIGRGGKWSEGVKAYALELMSNVDEAIECGDFEIANIDNTAELKKVLLNGAKNWEHYSMGGCALIANDDIRNRLYGKSVPQGTNFIEAQTLALLQAVAKIEEAVFATQEV